jgi:hypothetical protein
MARFGPKKQPSQGSIKAPENAAPNPESLHPIFCLKLLRGDGCVSACSQEQQAKFAETLRKLASLTWAQIKQAHRQGLGSEILRREDITPSAIPLNLSPDVKILGFRYWEKCRMLCYRNREVLHIFWLDRDYSAYDHGGS